MNEKVFEDGDILLFDISFNGTILKNIDIDDISLNSSFYLSGSNSVIGRVILNEDMLKKGENYYYNFIDFNFNSVLTSYVINRFVLIKSNDLITSSDSVIKDAEHTLYAIWEANS